MVSTRARRVGLIIAAAVVAVAMVVAVAVALSTPRYPGPLEVELTDEMLSEFGQRAEDQLLRERLGGLAALVIDDERLSGCIDDHPPAPLSQEAAADPVEAVRAATERIRGLDLSGEVEVRLFDDTEMTDRVAELFSGRWDDERIDAEYRKLTALGALEPGADLLSLRVDAFAAQVSGYFAGGAGEIGLRTTDPPELSPLEQVVLAHEYEHALTAEHLERPAAESADGALAASAVVEGSAVLTMLIYARSVLTDADRAQLREELLERARADALADYSPYLRAELKFPYVEGVRYLCERWLEGGWEAVDAAYEEPPASTAAVLFPERDPALPRQPAALGEPGELWDEVRRTDFGAARLEWLFAAPGGEPAAMPDPRERAGAWDGGELAVWASHEATAVGLALVDRGDGPPLCESVRIWFEVAFPDVRVDPAAHAGATFVDADRHAALTCDGDQVRLGIAPVAEAAAAIAR